MSRQAKNTFSNKVYNIISKQSEKALEAELCEGSSKVQINQLNGGENQQWKFEASGDPYYKLVNKNTGKALDIMLGGSANGTWLHQWDSVSSDSQLWFLEETDEGFYKIKSKVSGKCVDVVGMSQEDGARLQIWEDLNGDNQQWKLVEVVAKKAEKAVEQKEEAPAKEIVPEAPKAVVKAETKTSTKAKEPAACGKKLLQDRPKQKRKKRRRQLQWKPLWKKKLLQRLQPRRQRQRELPALRNNLK